MKMVKIALGCSFALLIAMAAAVAMGGLGDLGGMLGGGSKSKPEKSKSKNSSSGMGGLSGMMGGGGSSMGGSKSSGGAQLTAQEVAQIRNLLNQGNKLMSKGQGYTNKGKAWVTKQAQSYVTPQNTMKAMKALQDRVIEKGAAAISEEVVKNTEAVLDTLIAVAMNANLPTAGRLKKMRSQIIPVLVAGDNFVKTVSILALIKKIPGLGALVGNMQGIMKMLPVGLIPPGVMESGLGFMSKIAGSSGGMSGMIPGMGGSSKKEGSMLGGLTGMIPGMGGGDEVEVELE